MNWKQLLWNAAGAAAGGFASGVAVAPLGTPGAKNIVLTATVLPVLGVLLGLFQHPPDLPKRLP